MTTEICEETGKRVVNTTPVQVTIYSGRGELLSTKVTMIRGHDIQTLTAYARLGYQGWFIKGTTVRGETFLLPMVNNKPLQPAWNAFKKTLGMARKEMEISFPVTVFFQ